MKFNDFTRVSRNFYKAQPALIGHYKAKLTDIGHLRKAPVCLSVSTSEYDLVWNVKYCFSTPLSLISLGEIVCSSLVALDVRDKVQ